MLFSCSTVKPVELRYPMPHTLPFATRWLRLGYRQDQTAGIAQRTVTFERRNSGSMVVKKPAHTLTWLPLNSVTFQSSGMPLGN